ncbi:adenylyltransferase/cytidyltransferase family protein [Candidatus Pacearchaeota archaeon]|nr:adenylyltransferase/cytidyltransferase family protein [Candidatus Pacearchaeota archaeon]
MKIIISSGYFDPLHIGHIQYLRLAKKLGDHHIVILNNTKQVLLKKGFEFMPLKEKKEILMELGCVDRVFDSIDEDRSVSKSIEKIAKDNLNHKIIFAKGGDRFASEIPEAEICKKYGIEIIDGLGEKIQSSSELVSKAKNAGENSEKL